VNSNLCSVRHIFTSTFLSNFYVKCIWINRFGRFRFFLFVSITKVLKFLLLIWNNCFVAGMPVSRTNLTVLISKLESFNKSQCLIYRPTNRVVVDLHRSYFSSFVFYEQSTKCCSIHLVTSIFYKHSIVVTDLF